MMNLVRIACGNKITHNRYSQVAELVDATVMILLEGVTPW